MRELQFVGFARAFRKLDQLHLSNFTQKTFRTGKTVSMQTGLFLALYWYCSRMIIAYLGLNIEQNSRISTSAEAIQQASKCRPGQGTRGCPNRNGTHPRLQPVQERALDPADPLQMIVAAIGVRHWSAEGQSHPAGV